MRSANLPANGETIAAISGLNISAAPVVASDCPQSSWRSNELTRNPEVNAIE